MLGINNCFRYGAFVVGSLLCAWPSLLGAQNDGLVLGRSIAWRMTEGGDASFVTGIVLDSSGDPIENALVYLVDTPARTITSNDGRFEIRVREPGEWEIEVVKLGMRVISDTLLVPEGRSVFLVAIMQESQRTVCGLMVCDGGCEDLNVYVVDAVTLETPRVTASLVAESRGQRWENSALLDPDSSNSIGLGIPVTQPGFYSLEVRAQGYQPWRSGQIFLEPGECDVLENRNHTARLVPER